MLASINHPNIAAIHSLEEANGSRFLVLELVEGPTLADRLERGPLPIARKGPCFGALSVMIEGLMGVNSDEPGG